MADKRKEHAVDAAEAALIEAVFAGGRVPTAAELGPLFRKLWELGYAAGIDDERNGRIPTAEGMDPHLAELLKAAAQQEMANLPFARLIRDAGERRPSGLDVITFTSDQPSINAQIRREIAEEAVTRPPADDTPPLTLKKWTDVQQQIREGSYTIGPVTRKIPKPGRTFEMYEDKAPSDG